MCQSFLEESGDAEEEDTTEYLKDDQVPQLQQEEVELKEDISRKRRPRLVEQ